MPGDSSTAAVPTRHDQRLAAIYYGAAVLVLGFYGVRVCPFVAGLEAASVLATFALAFGTAFVLKLLFEPRLMPASEPFTLSVYQFGIDLGLFVLAGVGIALWNHHVRGFPLESGLKVLVGCVMFGIFAGLDNGLLRERGTPSLASATVPPSRIFPITDRLIVIFGAIALFTGMVAALIVVKDIDYLIDHFHEEPHAQLRRAVFIDIGFVIGVVLVLSVRLLWAYGRNLNYMLRLQIAGLDEVSAGRLERYVPVVTRDEFSLIACKTNQMIETLRRANHEQQELFEVSVALVTELRLDRLLARIVATTRAFVEADRVSLFLYDEASDELWSKVAEGVDTMLRFPADRGLAGHVFRTGETVILSDAYHDARFNRAVDELTGYRTRSMLAVPVSDREGCIIGVIQALNRTRGEFSEHDARRLQAFAAQAAIALVNAQLFADLDRARRYSESILQSLSNGVVTLDPDHRVVKLNQAARAILHQDESLVGRPFEAVLGPDADWWNELVGTADRAYLPDTEIALADGSRRSVNITRRPLADLENTPLGALLVFEDLTEGKRVRDTLSRYLPPQVARQVLADEDNALGGVSRVATVLFSDIRDFTTISEQIGARATVAMLNEYFPLMVDAINAHGGILDKFIGDAIMAVFGVPFPGDRDADDAMCTALEMLQRLEMFNAHRAEQGQDPIGMGIGLSTGELFAGNVGSPRRMNYTVIGDTVNLAARLETATKSYRVGLIVSGHTREALQHDYPMRELDLIRVKGKDTPVSVHQVFARDAVPASAVVEAFALGRRHYRERAFEAAIGCFGEVLARLPDDGPSLLYLDRCRRLQQHPPGPDWDGVWQIG
ncbi:MAG TPA: adenylate/guanylate cyclase domain-containing protein [Xanthomonadaceae bacterium]|nr:adenylate/guanylate cyclase domain-containing protein [Xanthomonadaceae bacterium]